MSRQYPTRPPRILVAVLVALVLALAGLGSATPAQAAYSRPSGLSAVSTATTSVRLAWKAVKKAPAYRIKYDDNPSMKSPAYATVRTAAVELGGLKPGHAYWVKVRVVSAKSKPLSAYGATLKVTTRKTGGFELLSPVALRAAAVADSSVSLSWTPRADAAGYRVRWATTTRLDDQAFQRTTEPSASLSDLQPGVSYYISVRAIAADGTNLSQYSPMVKVRTTGTASFEPPAAVSAKAASATSVRLAWKAPAGAHSYRVKYATTPWSDAEYLATDSSAVVLTGLDPATSYSLKVRILDEDGNLASGYSTTVTVTTLPASQPLRVASYNVRCANCGPDSPNEKPWATRRTAIVSTITAADPDVVGLQEAQQSRIIVNGVTQSVSQFEDLANRLGSPWALVDRSRYNCVKSSSPKHCVAKDQGASNGTRIVYRTDRLVMLTKGTVLLPRSPLHDYPRWLAWATFRQLSSGREFFFGTIHLEPDNDTGSSLAFYSTRKAQAEAVVAAIAKLNTAGLPVLLTGDPASNKWDEPSNAPYNVFVGAGLVDPLGNPDGSTKPVGATVQKRIRTEYNSFNAWDSIAHRSDNVNGTYTDYILTSPMRVSEWETVVRVDARNAFIGVIPSDHNLIRATVWLP